MIEYDTFNYIAGYWVGYTIVVYSGHILFVTLFPERFITQWIE